MIDALRSDIFRQGKRLMPKVLLTILVAMVALLYLLIWVTTEATQEGFTDESLRDLRANLRLDHAVSFGLGLAWQVGAVLAVVFAGSSAGGEYGAGTVRTMVLRTRARWHFVAAKLLDGTGFAFLLMLAGLLTSVAVSAAITPSLGGDYGDIIDAGFAGDLVLGLVRATWTIVPYVALAVFLGIWARSTAVAIGVSLAVLFLEGIAGSLLTLAGGVAEDVTQLFLSTNVSALLQASEIEGGETATDLPGVWQAAGIIALYTAAFAAPALYIFQRRDISAD